jgi:hypothetical protein
MTIFNYFVSFDSLWLKVFVGDLGRLYVGKTSPHILAAQQGTQQSGLVSIF